jgi:hypothetical protein
MTIIAARYGYKRPPGKRAKAAAIQASARVKGVLRPHGATVRPMYVVCTS